MPPTGYPMTLLPGRGIQRKLTLANVGAVAGLLARRRPGAPAGRPPPTGGRRGGRRLRQRGGRAGGGRCGGSRSWWPSRTRPRAPPTASLARFAKASAVSFPGTPLPRAVVTGNPIRAEISAIDPDRDRARRQARLRRGRRAGTWCSCSAGRSAPSASTRPCSRPLPAWRDRADLAVRHVVGRRDWDASSAPPPGRPRRPRATSWWPTRTTCRPPWPPPTWRCAGPGRAPASSWPPPGCPSILVPSPYVTADQQTGNARHLVDAGAAVLVPDADLDGARLVAEVDDLLADDARLAAMGAAAAELGPPRRRRPPSPPWPRPTPVAEPALDLDGRRGASTSPTWAAPA